MKDTTEKLIALIKSCDGDYKKLKKSELIDMVELCHKHRELFNEMHQELREEFSQFSAEIYLEDAKCYNC